MSRLLFATTNALKLRIAEQVLAGSGIELEQIAIEVPEIQGEDGELIVRDKAQKVFAQLQKPVAVSDDMWLIAGLGGFPGPYMKSLNHWFTLEDWLRLVNPLTDRRVTLRQCLVYQDSRQQQCFIVDVEGELVRKSRGDSSVNAMALVSFDGGKTTVAERENHGQAAVLQNHTVWHELRDWLQKTNKASQQI